MYGILEKLREREVKQRNKGHTEMNGKYALIVFILMAVIFAAMVWMANS